jgi:hypothetical protein
MTYETRCSAALEGLGWYLKTKYSVECRQLLHMTVFDFTNAKFLHKS